MDEFVRRPKRPKINLDSNSEAPKKVQNEHSAVLPKPTQVTQNYQPVIQEAMPEEPTSQPQQSPKTSFIDKIKNFKVPTPKTRKQWIIAIAVMIVLLGGTGYAIYYFIIRDNSPAVVQTVPEPEPAEPEKIYSKVSGREIGASINERPVYAVQIENSPEARPQSGLKEADVVFEAIAEGGITRFNALFHDNVPANIGPIRSLRPYFIDWFLPFDAAIVHAGGSPEALNDVGALRLKDIDHGSSSSIFKRSSDRYAPHNLYSSGQQILDLMGQRGFSSKVSSLPRKDAVPSEAPNAKTVSLRVSRGLYDVVFTYDAASNTYLRAQGGGPHIDAESKSQLAPSVVVVPIIPRSTHSNRIHTIYGTTDGGKVYVFQDGTVIEGTWKKSARNAQWQLLDASGKPIELNRGQTWFTMIESADRVTYAP